MSVEELNDIIDALAALPPIHGDDWQRDQQDIVTAIGALVRIAYRRKHRRGGYRHGMRKEDLPKSAEN